jgi:hypothetical protein
MIAAVYARKSILQRIQAAQCDLKRLRKRESN